LARLALRVGRRGASKSRLGEAAHTLRRSLFNGEGEAGAFVQIGARHCFRAERGKQAGKRASGLAGGAGCAERRLVAHAAPPHPKPARRDADTLQKSGEFGRAAPGWSGWLCLVPGRLARRLPRYSIQRAVK
jgi:hypothetical protein